MYINHNKIKSCKDDLHPVKYALHKSKFRWQTDYGAFTYSHSQIDNVIKYIMNQQEHHKKRTFRDEYIEFLNKFEIEYDEKYLFEFYD